MCLELRNPQLVEIVAILAVGILHPFLGLVRIAQSHWAEQSGVGPGFAMGKATGCVHVPGDLRDVQTVRCGI